jgi:hypothetical protein
MINSDYSTMSIDELLSVFENACLEQDETYITDDMEKFDRYFFIMVAVGDELKRRGVGARLSLLRFFSHENPQVRLQAAKCVYCAAPKEARQCLEDLAKARLCDQSLAAGMALRAIDNGTSMLT